MASNPECWLLNYEGIPLAQCLPGDCIGGSNAKHLAELKSSLVLDCMGSLWFAIQAAAEVEGSSLNGEIISAGASCLLAEGDNILRMDGNAFILRITGASKAAAESGELPWPSPGATIKQLRVLEVVRDPVFRAGELAEAMAKATFEAVDILSADRAALWLFSGRTEKGRMLELRASFDEGGFSEAAGRPSLLPETDLPASLDEIAGQFLGALTMERGHAALGAFQSCGMLGNACAAAMTITVGGGQGGSLGFLIIERWKGDREPWLEGDLLSAQCLASLVLQSLEARDRLEVIGALGDAKAAMAAELNAASTYVQKVLPPPISAGPIRAEWQFIPSSQLGGDSFSYEWVSPRFFTCYILDVVGHGTGASLLAISVMNSVRSLLLRDATNPPAPSAVLSHLNASFPMEQQSNLTFSMWFGLFDLTTRILRYSSGGHPPALLIVPDADAPGGSRAIELGVEGVAVGSWANYPYAEDNVVLPPRAKLFLYSDGAFEIPIEGGRQWSFGEFTALLRTAARMAGGETAYLRKKIGSLLDAPGFPDDFSIVRLSFDDNSA